MKVRAKATSLTTSSRSGERLQRRAPTSINGSHAAGSSVVAPNPIVDGNEILPWRHFLDRLWAGDLTR